MVNKTVNEMNKKNQQLKLNISKTYKACDKE